MGLTLDMVVVSYHSERDLQKFLQSCDAYPPDCEASLLVVDVESPSPAPTPFWWGLSQHGEDNDRAGMRFGHPENVGYARACNDAASRRQGDIIGFFNADTELRPGTLDKIMQAFAENERWGVIGPKQTNRAGKLTHAGIFGQPAAPEHRGWLERDAGQYDDVLEAVTVSGSAYFVRRSMWEELTDCPLYREIAPDARGAFLPTTHFYEETWCSYHARAHGWKVMYFGETSMIHEWTPSGTWAQAQMPKSREYFRKACAHHGLKCD